MAQHKFKVASYIDKPGWCIERHVDDLSKYIPDMEFLKTFNGEPLPDGDLALIWNWPFLRHVDTAHLQKVATFLLDHWSIDYYRRRGLNFYDLVNEKADYLVVLNEEMWSQVIHYVDVPVFWLRYGVDTEAFKVLPLPDEIIFGWCGDVSCGIDNGELKGYQVIRKVCQALNVPYIEANSDYPIPLNKMSSKYYEKISVHICFSATEGCNNTILEALSSGRPVITTAAGCAKYLIRNMQNGLIIRRDPLSLEVAVRHFTGRELERMSKNCERVRLQETWQQRSLEWNSAFREMIES